MLYARTVHHLTSLSELLAKVARNQNEAASSYSTDEGQPMAAEVERLKLEKKIQRYRRIARELAIDSDTAKLILEFVADLERKLREMDE